MYTFFIIMLRNYLKISIYLKGKKLMNEVIPVKKKINAFLGIYTQKNPTFYQILATFRQKTHNFP